MPPDPNDTMALAMRDLRREYRPISREEELQLLPLAKAGDKRAIGTLVHSVMPLAIKKAMRYTDLLEDSEKVSAAGMGVMDAIRCHRPERGTRLTTTVGWHVLKTVMQSVRATGTIRTGREWRRKNEDAARAMWRPESIDAIGRENVPELARLAFTPPDYSLDDHKEAVWLRRQIWKLKNPRHRQVLRMRFYDGMTLLACSVKLGVCRERVRQLQRDALWKLGRIIFRSRMRRKVA